MRINHIIFTFFLFLTSIANAEIVEVQVTMHLLRQDKMPAAGYSYSGECESSENDSYFSKKINNKLSCVADKNGVCKFKYKTYQLKPDLYSICKYIEDAKINSRPASPSSWGRFPDRSKNHIYVTVTEKNDQWDWVSDNPTAVSKLNELVLFNNQTYYGNEVDFEKNRISHDPLEFYIAKTSIKNDDMEVLAVLDTSAAHNRNSMRFIRALINKKTLKTNYQIYVIDKYYDNSFRKYNSAKYIEANEPVVTSVSVLDQDVNCSLKNHAGNCLFQETVLFNLSEEIFSRISDSYNKNKTGTWAYRISSHSGYDLNSSIPFAEFMAISAKAKEFIELKK